MAGRTLDVDMLDDDQLPAWATIIQLAQTGASAHWTLVGGLMVAAHARRARIDMRRPTDDVDMLVDYMTNQSSLAQARAALFDLDFHLSDDEQHAYRFRHADGRKIDLMVADHLPSRMQPRLSGRPAFEAPAGQQAISRRDNYQLRFIEGLIVSVAVPDELGALVAKSAAWLADRRDRHRHIDDIAVLLACVDDASAINYDSTNKNDRKRIRATTDILADKSHSSWINLAEADRRRGQVNLALIRQALQL